MAWRILKWTLLTLLIVLVVLIGVVAWVAGTRSGTEFAWSQAKSFLPAGIHVDSVKGRLIGPLEVRGVAVDTDSMHARVNAVDLDWSASELWSLTVHVKNLAVRGVDYQVTKIVPPTPEPESSEPFQMPQSISLPVTVQIDRVAVDDVSASTAPQAAPFVLDRARLLDAHLDDDAWRIKSLTGHGPMFDVDAHAGVKPNGSYATNLHAKTSLRLPDLAPVNAVADINGDLDALKLNANVDAPYNLALNGQVRHALDDPAVDATANLNDTRTQAIRASLPGATINAKLAAQGPIDDLAVNLDTRADTADYGKAVLRAAIHYTPELVRIESLDFDSPDVNGNLAAKGQVALAQGNAMDLTLDWSKLQWPLKGQAAYRTDDGHVRLTGPLDDYELATNLSWQVVGQTQGQLALNGHGSTQAFDLRTLKVTGGPGDIDGHAKIAWSPALDAQVHLDGRHINPGAVVAQVPGDFDLVADVNAKQANGVLRADVNTLTADGTLRKQPLHLNAKAEYRGDHVDVDAFKLAFGATSAQIGGRFGWTPEAKLDGRWTINSTDLSTAWPTLAGRLDTEGQVSGTVAAPNVDARLTANDIAAAGSTINHAGLNAKVDWSGDSRSNVDLDISGVDAAGQKIDTVTLRADGTPASHRLTARVDSAIAKADLGLDGHLNKQTQRYRFTLDRLKAGYGQLAPWTLANTASGALSADAQSLDNACLTSGAARLCLQGAHDAANTRAKIRLSDLAYAYAKPFFPDGLNVDGSISGNVDATLPSGGTPDVDADLRTSGGSVSMLGAAADRVQIVDLAPGRIRLTMGPPGLNADVDLPLTTGGGINARAAVGGGQAPLTERPLNGRLRVELADLGFISQLAPEIASIQGNIDGDLRLDGTLARPNVLGKLAVNAPRTVLVTPGLVVENTSLAAVGQGRSIAIQGHAESGGGPLNINGNIALNQGGQDIDLAIQGQRFQVANIPDATAYISPDLKVGVTPARVDVTGSVTVPEASITPRNLPESGVQTVSSDQVIVSNDDQQTTAPTEAAGREIHANVKVILGDAVHIEAFGLKADLAGNLRVVQEPGSPTTGTGQIDIQNGSYKAYGQNLDIETGKILFAGGPVSEPGIDIRAARHPNDDVTVGVQARGPATSPRLTLFSDPGMNQSEQLSWLLLGRPLQSTSGQQSSMVTRAALAIGMSKGNSVLGGVGKKLGLDLGIGSTEDSGPGQDTGGSDNAAFTVGKYLSPKLYVSYGIGLFNPVSTLSLRYTLSSHWKLQTQSSGVATGGDLIYSIDR